MKYRSSSSSPLGFIPCLGIIIVLLFQCSMSSDPIHHFCKEAAKRDPNFTCDFCVATLEANPKTQNIATLEELVAFSIELAMSNATSVSSLITQLLNQKDLDAYTRGALKDCSELYSNAYSSLRDAMDDFESKDYFKANFDTSAAMDSSSTCEDGFKDREGEFSPLTQENINFFRLTAMVLTFLSMLR